MRLVHIPPFLLLTAGLMSGCRNIDEALPKKQILPISGPEGQKWLQDITAASFLKEGVLKGAATADKTVIIANADGTTYRVTIHYRDPAVLSGTGPFSPAAKIFKDTFSLGDSLLTLNPSGWKWSYKSYMQELLTLTDEMRAFQSADFQTSLNAGVGDLLANQLETVAIKQSTNLEINVSLDAMLAAYLRAYLEGTYVNRWGVPVSRPDITKLGNDTLGAFTEVALEAFFDYSLMTPIVHSSSGAGTNKVPTFAVLFPQLYQATSTNPDAPGITTAENESINYLSGLSDEGAKHLSSLIIKSLGGASFGVKVSTGDNSAFSEVISTLCEEISRRTTEKVAYEFFERFEYYPTNDDALGYAPDIPANNTNLFPMEPLVQKAVVALLMTQDQLESLDKGGWTLSPANNVNYQSLATALLGTNALTGHITNYLSGNVLAILKSPPPLSSGNRQVLIDSLNHLLVTPGGIYDSNAFANVNLSPDTRNLLSRNALHPLQGADLAHLNWSLLLDAFPAELAPLRDGQNAAPNPHQP